MGYLVLTILCLVLGQALVCIWNEVNLDTRRHHRIMAEHFIKVGRRDHAMYHIEKARNASKRFIRFGGPK